MSLIGNVDTLAGMCISGWAADDADYTRQVSVDVVVNFRVVATLPCNRFREDLRAAGLGDGCKAFQFDATSRLKPGRNNLEVRYAGTEAAVPNGRGHWVTRRQGSLAGWEQDFIAAFEAYHEFGPEQHICYIGDRPGEVERLLRKAPLPFRRFTGLETATAIERAESTPGLLVAGFTGSAENSQQIRRVFQEYGVPAVTLESISMAPDGARRLFAFAEIGGAGISAETTPVLAHIHVPKCAGTSFRVLLEKYFGARHLPLYINDTYFVYGEETLRGYLLQNPQVTGFSSHHVRSFPHWIAGREMLYITFLRDPVEQFVSYMTHCKKQYSTITSKSLLEALPPDAPTLPLREFARWLLTQDRDIPFRENHNVNFFARHSAPEAADRLAAAREALENFFFVGLTERMEESMDKLRTRVEAAGLDFPPDPAPVENTSHDFRDDLSWINSEDEVGAMLLRSVEKDRQLYDWAVKRFMAA